MLFGETGKMLTDEEAGVIPPDGTIFLKYTDTSVYLNRSSLPGKRYGEE